MKRQLTAISSMLPQPYAQIALRWWWLVFLCAILAAGAALWMSFSMSPTYQATSQLLINQARGPVGDTYSDLLLSERLASTYAQLMTRDSMLAQTLAKLGLDPEAAAGVITDLRVAPVRDTQLVELTVEGTSPEIIVAVGNTLPSVFEEELLAVQTDRYAESKASLSNQLDALSRQIEETQVAIAALGDARAAQEELEYTRLTNLLVQYQTSYSDVLQNYEEVRLAEAQAVDTIVIMQAAELPEAPIRPRTRVNVLLAAVVGAMLAVGAVFLAEFLDHRVHTPEDLARITDLPVLGAVATSDMQASDAYEPKFLISLWHPRHPTVEAYRRVRTNLQFSNVDRALRTLTITSAVVGEGKSLTAANLAVVFAQSGLSVIIVDADLRRPRQHQLFGLSKSPGLSDAILSDDVAPFLRAPGVDVDHLKVLTAGDSVAFPAEVLGSNRMRHLIEELTVQADIVVFDTPPVLAVTDSQVIGQQTDGTVLVIDSQGTTEALVRQSLEALLQVNVPMVGAILNRMANRPGSYYLYGYYQYGEETEAKHDGSKRSKRRNSRDGVTTLATDGSTASGPPA